MSEQFVFIAEDSNSTVGRIVNLMIEKSPDLEDSLSMFSTQLKPKGETEVLSRVEFFDRYGDFVPDTVKGILDGGMVSGFVWSSKLFFNYS